MKRDGSCPLPSSRTANNIPKWAQTNYPASKANVARNQRLPSALSQQMARQMKMPPRTAVRKPVATRAKPKSSQRILYFAHNAKPVNRAPPQNMRYQQTRKQPNLSQVQTKPPVVRAPPQRLQSPRAPNKAQYEVPEVSNKVFRYINERASAAAAASANAAKATNPLLKYLQYHRSHPTKETQMIQGPPKRIDRRSIVTIIEQ